MNSKQQQNKLRNSSYKNLKTFLEESTLHGLRFIGNDTITLWERAFFLCAFLAALLTTGQLIGFIYSQWNLTPIIIAINPFPTSISQIPFPSITLCNMNQLVLSKVSNYGGKSHEYGIMDIICDDEFALNGNENSTYDQNNNISITEFLDKHAQSCSDMLLSCYFNSIHYDCDDLFRDIITDEGFCCAFNLVHSKYLSKIPRKIEREHHKTERAVPVAWSPEFGYQKVLPKDYYPRTANGIGVSMGLTLVLDAQVHEYYCSTTNGAGFKVDIQNPIEAPRIKDTGITIPVGKDTRFSVTAHSTSATSDIRETSSSIRQCLFDGERILIFYKYYTRKNCANECYAWFFYSTCKCIPYYLPLIFPNSSICGVPNKSCIKEARRQLRKSTSIVCHENCLENCFGLTYKANSFSSSLIQGNYIIENTKNLENRSLEYIRDNIAIVNIYFNEFVFYGQVQNVYVGYTEFLSNIGGVLGLFLGFSFISLIEVFYYAILCPIFRWMQSGNQRNELVALPEVNFNTSVWERRREVFPTKQKHLKNGLVAYRQRKFGKIKN